MSTADSPPAADQAAEAALVATHTYINDWNRGGWVLSTTSTVQLNSILHYKRNEWCRYKVGRKSADVAESTPCCAKIAGKMLVRPQKQHSICPNHTLRRCAPSPLLIFWWLHTTEIPACHCIVEQVSLPWGFLTCTT